MFCKAKDAARVQRILRRWGFYWPHMTTAAKFDAETLGDPVDPESMPPEAEDEFVLVVNGEPKDIAVSLVIANSADPTIGEGWLLKLLACLELPSVNLGGPMPVMRARAVLSKAIRESLE